MLVMSRNSIKSIHNFKSETENVQLNQYYAIEVRVSGSDFYRFLHIIFLQISTYLHIFVHISTYLYISALI